MNAIKHYLLRLILCGFLASLSGAVLRGRRGGRAVALCGGCLMILTALHPLLQVDLTKLPELADGLTRSQREELAREKNDAILQGLIEEQTAAWIEAQAAELGLRLRVSVTARPGEGGSFVPYAAELHGSWTQEGRQQLSALLEKELALPAARQRWVTE